MDNNLKRALFITVATLNAQAVNAGALKFDQKTGSSLHLKNLEEIHLSNKQTVNSKEIEGYYVNTAAIEHSSANDIIQVILKNGQVLDRREVTAVKSFGFNNLVPLEKESTIEGVSVFVVNPKEGSMFHSRPQMWGE